VQWNIKIQAECQSTLFWKMGSVSTGAPRLFYFWVSDLLRFIS